jgi:hypothetical protein
MKAASTPACAIGTFIGLHDRKRIFFKLGFGLGPDLTIIGNLHLNMMLKIEF